MFLIAAPFRLVGYALFIAGTLAGFFDVAVSVNSERLIVTTLGELLWGNARDLAFALETYVRTTWGDPAWDDIATTVMRLPGWLVLYLVGALFLLVAQLIYRKR